MSIENAAREIAQHCELVNEGCISAIIRRRLFPMVKPEWVEKEKFYWIKSNAKWSCEIGGWIVFFDNVDEIRGPVPCPE